MSSQIVMLKAGTLIKGTVKNAALPALVDGVALKQLLTGSARSVKTLPNGLFQPNGRAKPLPIQISATDNSASVQMWTATAKATEITDLVMVRVTELNGVDFVTEQYTLHKAQFCNMDWQCTGAADDATDDSESEHYQIVFESIKTELFNVNAAKDGVASALNITQFTNGAESLSVT